MSHVAVIGSGFSGLAAACFVARAGHRVSVFEKHSTPGGRARNFHEAGFTFDMGPSWYWMPDVFEKFFNHFGKSTSDYYSLQRLDPSYRIYFGKNDFMDVPSGVDELVRMFEHIEAGSGKYLLRFLDEAKFKYEAAIHRLVYKSGLSFTDLLDPAIVRGIMRFHLFESVSKYIRRFFKDPRLIKILEFPVLFLGATPEKTPALYTLMNYADMALGTWYPRGGMYSIVEGMASLARELGVSFQFGSNVTSIETDGDETKGVWCEKEFMRSDYVIASADYHHVEQHLLGAEFRNYPDSYWETRVLAPSCVLYYIGLNRKLNNVLHHTLFFDEDFALHAQEIYERPQWPSAPQFYVSCPSKTDPAMAPADGETLMLLVPVAAGLSDHDQVRERYFDLIVDRLEKTTGESIRDHIVYKRSYAHNDFINDYNSYKGNAYGLANTLLQTANFKPSIRNKQLKNLFYTGQLTVPGPGVPPSLISGQVVARELLRQTGHKNFQFV